MSAETVIDVTFLKPVLEEFGIRGDLAAIRGGECRLECARERAVVNITLLQSRFQFPMLSRTDTGDTSVIWFRVNRRPST